MSRGKGRYGQAAPCPACDAMVSIRKRPHRGQTMVCNSCDSLLEVINLSPLMFEWAFEELDDIPTENSDEEFAGWKYSEFVEPGDENVYASYDDPDEDKYMGSYRNGRRV